MTREVVAIAASDLHMRSSAPISRSEEPDWFAAMDRPFKVLRDECETHDVPLLVAGDLFHVWYSSAELINWAVGALPETVYAIPGQHDMPGHRSDELSRSAYWTLASTERIHHIADYTYVYPSEDLRVFGFGWNSQVVFPNNEIRLPGVLDVAIIHAHVYSGSGHIGVDPSCDITGWNSKLKGYNAAFFGDNHAGFETKVGKCNVMNCGGLLAVNSDERLRRPGYGVLYSDGTIERRFFDVSADVWTLPQDTVETITAGHMSSDLIKSLASLSEKAKNYPDAVRSFLVDNPQPPSVSQLLKDTLDRVGTQRGD